jgi:uncharacterized protein
MALRHHLLVLLLGTQSLLATAQNTVDDALRAVQSGRTADAVQILQPLADKGNALAQLQLGMLYYNGKGVKENEKLAIDLLTKSANQGNVEAMLQLGNAYTFGNETAKLVADPDVEAARWYFKAASAGNADAQYTLGLLFMAGKGLYRDDKEASAWMHKAAKQGHKDAQNYVSGGK